MPAEGMERPGVEEEMPESDAITTTIGSTDIPGWFELIGERLGADGCQRERWTFQRTYSAFLVVALTRYTAETRPSRRHRTWTRTADWPGRGAADPPIPPGLVDRVMAAARERVVVVLPASSHAHA